jgi:hypothetical protein
MNSFTQSVSKFVVKFLVDNSSEELVEKWNTQNNIEAFNVVASKPSKLSKPKRGKSAYIFFCAASRFQIKEELGEKRKGMIMSELGKRWKELKKDKDRAEELAKYTKMSEDDKARYVNTTEPVPKKQKKNANYPKKMTGYEYFCSVNRETVKTDNLGMKARDITRELSRLWNELPKDEQKKWSASSAELYTYWKNKIQQ